MCFPILFYNTTKENKWLVGVPLAACNQLWLPRIETPSVNTQPRSHPVFGWGIWLRRMVCDILINSYLRNWTWIQKISNMIKIRNTYFAVFVMPTWIWCRCRQTKANVRGQLRRGGTMATLGLRLYQKTDPNSDFAILLENKKTKNSLLFQAGTVATLCKCEGGVHVCKIW